jgi:hypothetical protein
MLYSPPILPLTPLCVTGILCFNNPCRQSPLQCRVQLPQQSQTERKHNLKKKVAARAPIKSHRTIQRLTDFQKKQPTFLQKPSTIALSLHQVWAQTRHYDLEQF